jgi:hypothetical protein
MLEKLNKLKNRAEEEIAVLKTLNDLESLRVNYLGKKSKLTEILKGLGGLSPDERKQIGMEANNIKNSITALLAEKSKELSASAVKQDISKVSDFDITLPGNNYTPGSFNPVTIVQREIEKIFAGMGFNIVDGPEVEDDFHNFEALNIPPHHPARDMQDTYWLENGQLLRTHPECLQVGQPVPPHIVQLRSSSNPGSTNGKKPGLNLTFTSLLNTLESSSFITYIRFAMETFLSIIIPSSWKNVFSCDASVLSFLKHLPGAITLRGAPNFCMALT